IEEERVGVDVALAGVAAMNVGKGHVGARPNCELIWRVGPHDAAVGEQGIGTHAASFACGRVVVEQAVDRLNVACADGAATAVAFITVIATSPIAVECALDQFKVICGDRAASTSGKIKRYRLVPIKGAVTSGDLICTHSAATGPVKLLYTVHPVACERTANEFDSVTQNC